MATVKRLMFRMLVRMFGASLDEMEAEFSPDPKRRTQRDIHARLRTIAEQEVRRHVDEVFGEPDEPQQVPLCAKCGKFHFPNEPVLPPIESEPPPLPAFDPRTWVGEKVASIFSKRPRHGPSIAVDPTANEMRLAEEALAQARVAWDAEKAATGQPSGKYACGVCGRRGAPQRGGDVYGSAEDHAQESLKAMGEFMEQQRQSAELREPTSTEFVQYTDADGKDRFAIVMHYETNAYQAPEVRGPERAHLLVLEEGTGGDYRARYVYNAPRHVVEKLAPDPDDNPRPPPGSWCFPMRHAVLPGMNGAGQVVTAHVVHPPSGPA